MSNTTIKVLLVDDQALFREALRTLLDLHEEIEIVGEAGNGHEALEMVERYAPRVVLMDVQMPKMDGVSATRAIRERFPETSVIVLTTFDDDEHVFEGLRAGAVGYLLKDVASERLTEAVLAVARGESFLQPSVAAKVVSEFARLSERPLATARANQGLAEPLSSREQEVLAQLARGASNREIAVALSIAEGTVKNHVTNILGKLGVRDRTQAALQARELGLL